MFPLRGKFFQDFGAYCWPKFRSESVFTAMTDPYCSPNDPLRASVSLFFPLWADYPLVLSCQDLGTPSKVEGELPEEGVGGIFDDGGKPCPGSAVMEMGESEILLDECATRLHKR